MRTVFHSRLRGVALIFLCGMGVSGLFAADASPTPKKEEAQPKIVLSAPVELKLKEFLTKAKAEKEKSWEEQMNREIDEIAKATGLDDKAKQALDAPAKQAIDASENDWADKLDSTLRTEIAPQTPDQALMMLDQMESQLALIVLQVDWAGSGLSLPIDQGAWTDGLKNVLTADQASAWDKAQAQRRLDVEKQMGNALKNAVDRTQNQYQQEISVQCRDIERTLGLTKERSDKLDDLAKSVTEKATEKWQKQADSMLIAMDDDQRSQIAKSGNLFIFSDPKESPGQQPEWKEGMAQMLTADEVNHLQQVGDERKAKLAHVLGQIMIALLDEKIAFTEAQRQKLEPISDRLAKDMMATFPETGSGTFNNCPPGTFIAAGAKATDAELRPILDAAQLKEWQKFKKPEQPEAAPPADSKANPVETGEPEDIEKQISEFLYKKAESERKRALAANVLRTEDAVRVSGVSPEIASHLETATRGATEDYLTRWKWFIEQQVRSQIQDATPQNVKQRLNNIQDFFFQQNFAQQVFGQQGGSNESVLDKTLKTDLSEKQQAAWKMELDARNAYQNKAITALVMEEFDRRYQLSPDQWAKLEPIITGVLHDYSEDITRMFSAANPVPWYLEGSYVLMPFVGVPDKDLKAILTPEQMDRWNTSDDHANAGNLWQNIEQIHKSRPGVNHA